MTDSPPKTFTFAPEIMNTEHGEILTAIPTQYKDVIFKSRLEARFAEWIDSKRSSVTWSYEPKIPGLTYRPDFRLFNELLPGYEIFVEIKPFKFLKELQIFDKEIGTMKQPWICVDSPDRYRWKANLWNRAFCSSVYFLGDVWLDLFKGGLYLESSGTVWIPGGWPKETIIHSRSKS